MKRLCTLGFLLFGMSLQGQAAQPCCSVVAIDAVPCCAVVSPLR
jgi:hypothetical protein